MRHKLRTVKIIAALGIPLFPLGAYFFPPHSEAPGFQGTPPAPGEIQATPAAGLEPERPAESGKPPGEPLPPIGAEALARVFAPPKKAAAGGQAPGNDPSIQTRPVPGEGKFSYLGSIRESNNREWLYIKEEASGRILSIEASAGSINEERCVVEIDGTSYLIRRN
jgi:hypothetical protein